LSFRVGWANLLRNYLEKKNKGILELYDLGIDRDTTENLLERFDAEAKARFPNVAIGANDSFYRKNKNNPSVPVREFENNLLKLIQKARKFTGKIVFVGMAKGDDSRTKPLPDSTTGKCYDKENIKIYNDIIKKVAKKEKSLFIEIINKLNDKDFYDGLHPNVNGHRKIFGVIKDSLVKNKII